MLVCFSPPPMRCSWHAWAHDNVVSTHGCGEAIISRDGGSHVPFPPSGARRRSLFFSRPSLCSNVLATLNGQRGAMWWRRPVGYWLLWRLYWLLWQPCCLLWLLWRLLVIVAATACCGGYNGYCGGYNVCCSRLYWLL